MIRVVNLKNCVLNDNEVLVKVDKSSVLNNPFKIDDKNDASKVYEKYKEYFYNKIKLQDFDFITELNKIYDLSYETNIALGCLCTNLKCYAGVIKEYIDRLRKWCHWQKETENGIFCTAHMALNRSYTCPYKVLEDRTNCLYPCSDYLPYYECDNLLEKNK